MNVRVFSVALLCSVCAAGQASAEPVTPADVDRAQVEMIDRVSEAAFRYARQIDIDQAYVYYCQQELHLKTYEHPANGAIHFGVDYHDITDSEKLDIVISTRENYERSFLILCLANAKNALREAAK